VHSPRADVAIISTAHDVADARLHKIVAALARSGLAVELFGLGDPAGAPARARAFTVPRRGLFARLARALTLPWRSRARVVMTVDPDLVPMARLACVLRRRKVVVDVHEDYTRLLDDREWAKGPLGAGANLVAQLSTRLAAGADLTSVADQHIPPTTARRRVVVENKPDVDLLTVGVPRDREPRAVYVGDLRTSRGLFDMVEAIAAAPDWSLDLIGPVAGPDVAALRARLSRPDVDGRVRLHGRQPPERAWQLAAGSWVGFVLLHITPAFLEAMPTKLSEYIASGMPAVSTRLPKQAKLIEESGAGVVVDSVDDVAALLRRWSADPSGLDPLRGAALEWARNQHNGPSPYDELAAEIVALVHGDSDRTN